MRLGSRLRLLLGKGSNDLPQGKTLAFGLPIVMRMAADVAEGNYELRRGRSPRLIVMVPTRELCRQASAFFLGQLWGLLSGVRGLDTLNNDETIN